MLIYPSIFDLHLSKQASKSKHCKTSPISHCIHRRNQRAQYIRATCCACWASLLCVAGSAAASFSDFELKWLLHWKMEMNVSKRRLLWWWYHQSICLVSVICRHISPSMWLIDIIGQPNEGLGCRYDKNQKRDTMWLTIDGNYETLIPANELCNFFGRRWSRENKGWS